MISEPPEDFSVASMMLISGSAEKPGNVDQYLGGNTRRLDSPVQEMAFIGPSHAISQAHRFEVVVGHVDRRGSEMRPHFLQFGAHRVAKLIEGTLGFVQEARDAETRALLKAVRCRCPLLRA